MSGFISRFSSAMLCPNTGWKTTHFWGPVANWGISLAAIYDMQYKGLDVVSYNMTGTLMVYSMFFMRFAWMVQPRNYILLACHTANVSAQGTQLMRKWNYDNAVAQQQSDSTSSPSSSNSTGAKTALGMMGIVPMMKEKVLKIPMPSTVNAFLAHPAGPFTIHFWAPTFKWNLSIANLLDYKRPTESVSTAQQIALAATGVIWTRWSFVINPVNYNLAAVNIGLAASSLYQLGRKLVYDPFPSIKQDLMSKQPVKDSH